MTQRRSKRHGSSITRRSLLKGSAAAGGAAAAAALGGFPTVWAQDIKDIEINMLGSAVSHIKKLEEMAEAALGFQLLQTVVDFNTLGQRAATQPRSFDTVEPAYQQFNAIWPTGNFQAIDTTKLAYWDQAIGLYKKVGKIWPDAWYGQGQHPTQVQYTSGIDTRDFAEPETRWLTVLPTNHNADTLGIRPDLIGRPIESWAEFINPEFEGRTALQGFPQIGLMDLAMAIEAQGMMSYVNKGNMTRDEIDSTIDFLIELKKKGHFRAFWLTFNESVNLMLSGEVVIQSMWSPAVTAVRSQGVPCIYTDLKEGYRSWALGFLLSKYVEGKKLGAVYDFFDWYYSGPAGAFFARQGYYMPTPEQTRQHLPADEWDFWFEGLPAVNEIKDPFGNVMEKPGTVRDGGSWKNRMGRVAVWNSTMDENAYVIQRWNEFLTA